MPLADKVFAAAVLTFAGAAIAAADLKPEFFYSDDTLLRAVGRNSEAYCADHEMERRRLDSFAEFAGALNLTGPVFWKKPCVDVTVE